MRDQDGVSEWRGYLYICMCACREYISTVITKAQAAREKESSHVPASGVEFKNKQRVEEGGEGRVRERERLGLKRTRTGGE